MAKTSQTFSTLKKLYDKRAALDKQIISTEKKLITEVEKAGKTASSTKTVKKPTGKKPGRKPLNKKPASPAQ